jgi:hypothetical protein
MELSVYIFGMMMYSLGGGLHFMLAVLHFQDKHYFRAGVYGMFAISMVLFMAELIFR